MTPKKELKIAYYLILILFFVGVISYAAFPAKTPDQPIRLMYKGVAGKVLFDHNTHLSDSGYGIICADCHHHYEFEGSSGIDGEEPVVQACGVCHQAVTKDQKLPESCLDCHEPEDIEESEMTKKTDAFHLQCIRCHQEVEAGPEECSSCHVM